MFLRADRIDYEPFSVNTETLYWHSQYVCAELFQSARLHSEKSAESETAGGNSAGKL